MEPNTFQAEVEAAIFTEGSVASFFDDVIRLGLRSTPRFRLGSGNFREVCRHLKSVTAKMEEEDSAAAGVH